MYHKDDYHGWWFNFSQLDAAEPRVTMATAETMAREPMLQELFLLGSDSGLIVPSGSINLVYNIAGSSGGPWLPAQ